MKRTAVCFICISFLVVASCKLFLNSDSSLYHKCFFIAEDSFDIEGEIFVNDALTAKADFEKITVKAGLKGWETEGSKTSGNKYALTVNTTSNGITLTPAENAAYKKKELDLDSYISILDFPYVLTFYVDGRTTRNAISPALGNYYFVYIPESANLSRKFVEDVDSVWGDYTSYTYYDYNFSKPGWYKIYSSEKPIGNNSAYSSGKNTIIRAPE